MSVSRRLSVGLLIAVLALAVFQGRASWLRGHPFTADAATRLGHVAGRVEACLRQSDLVLSQANAPKLRGCVCVAESVSSRGYCFIGDGFVAFDGRALPEGVFSVADDPYYPTQGMAYVPMGATGPSAQEFDRNFGSFGPSGPPGPGWHRVSFCPRCD